MSKPRGWVGGAFAAAVLALGLAAGCGSSGSPDDPGPEACEAGVPGEGGGSAGTAGTPDTGAGNDAATDTAVLDAGEGGVTIPQRLCTPNVTSCGGLCGKVADGCGKVYNCGGCPTVAIDGGAPVAQDCDPDTNKCVTIKNSCAALGAQCGRVKFTCGRREDCGYCGPTQRCNPDTNQCVPAEALTDAQICAGLGYECGAAVWVGLGDPNLTGAHLKNCGSCATGSVCNNLNHLCELEGTPEADAKVCTDAGAQCGLVSNKRGGQVNCDTALGGCPTGQGCGVGGEPNKCAPSVDTSLCEVLGRNCGTVQDSCGGTITCGTCLSPLVCNANGICGPQCAPRTQTDCPTLLAAAQVTCGAFPDGCNGTVRCEAACTGGQVCTGGLCKVPLTCADYPGKCGAQDNGVGGTINCDGNCGGGQFCSAAKTCCNTPSCNGVCGTTLTACGRDFACDCPNPSTYRCRSPGAGQPSTCCLKRTCADYPGQCGSALDDGCGGTISCASSCAAGTACLANGTCCTNLTCAGNYPGLCGAQSNGCGGNLGCTCASGRTCLGNGTCCVRRTCAFYPNQCGAALDDGCGGTISCRNACTGGNVCNTGTNNCQAQTTCASAYPSPACGTGLANPTTGLPALTCNCPSGQSCSSSTSGVAGTCCASASCTGRPCGTTQTDCRQTISCGCGSGQVCNSGTCCTRRTCAGNYPGQCGTALSDNCGGTLNCSGNCAGGAICQGGTTCCTRRTCAGNYPGQCGSALDDGCGGTLNCSGTCQAPNTCGAVTPGLCGCRQRSCGDQNIQCGSATDTCGAAISCGACPNPNNWAGMQCVSGQCQCIPTRTRCDNGVCGSQDNGCGVFIPCGC